MQMPWSETPTNTQPSATPETGSTGPPSPMVPPPSYISPEELRRAFSSATTSPQPAPRAGSLSIVGILSSVLGWRGVAAAAGPRYPQLMLGSKDPLFGLKLPPEHALRASALDIPLGTSGTPMLPQDVAGSPLAEVLDGWSATYELCCGEPGELQRVMGRCYTAAAVFEDPLVVAAGLQAVYRQFAVMGAAVRGVQVHAYSLAAMPVGTLQLQPPAGQAPAPSEGAAGGGPAPGLVLMTRISLECLQTFELGLPPPLSWLAGKAATWKVPLYVTSVLLVASQQPLAPIRPPPPSHTRAGPSLSPSAPAREQPAPPAPAREGGAAAAAPADGAWRIVYHADRWHNIPVVWPLLRRTVCQLLDLLLVRVAGF